MTDVLDLTARADALELAGDLAAVAGDPAAVVEVLRRYGDEYGLEATRGACAAVVVVTYGELIKQTPTPGAPVPMVHPRESESNRE